MRVRGGRDDQGLRSVNFITLLCGVIEVKKIEAYKAILATVDSCLAATQIDRIVEFRSELKSLIRLEELSAEFGVEIPRYCGYGNCWYKLSEFQAIGFYGGDQNRTISCSDDGSQPENEWLYVIRFPTGAYIFGQGYPTKTFQKFFNELKQFGPKYIDSANRALYFTSEKSASIHAALPEIFKRYKGLVDAELKEKRVKVLQDELEKLQGV